MKRQRFAILAVVALAVLAGAFLASSRRNQAARAEATPLVPWLAAQMNAVTEVDIRKGAARAGLTVHKTADRWTVAQRADYPADVAKLRKVLLAIGAAKIVEEKTADPARFTAIGLDDPAESGSAGTEVTVKSPAAATSIVIGKPAGEGNFARRAGEKQSYLVEPGISLETEPRYWIDARLLDVPTASIRKIDVTPAAGSPYGLERVKPDASAFELVGVPSGRQALDSAALAPSPTLLANLEAEEVAPATDIDFTPSSQVTVTLADGGLLTLTGAVAGDKHWIKLHSSYDAPLNAKAEGRAFEVASYRYDAVFKPVEQLLVPKQAPKQAPARRAAAPAP